MEGKRSSFVFVADWSLSHSNWMRLLFPSSFTQWKEHLFEATWNNSSSCSLRELYSSRIWLDPSKFRVYCTLPLCPYEKIGLTSSNVQLRTRLCARMGTSDDQGTMMSTWTRVFSFYKASHCFQPQKTTSLRSCLKWTKLRSSATILHVDRWFW